MAHLISGKNKNRNRNKDGSSSSRISTTYLEQLLESLKNQKHKNSTKKTYYKVWSKFNEFLIKLDRKPKTWEHCTSIYCTYLVTILHRQSSTIKSYVSAIKSILTTDGYPWDDKKVLLNTIIKSCKLKNDRLKIRLPIQLGLLDIFLYEIRRKFIDTNQPYLEALYMTAYLLAYYGLLRVGELTQSEHTVKAINIHESTTRGKDKLLLVLYSSKTHGLGSRPQKIFITGKNNLEVTENTEKTSIHYLKHNNTGTYCPVQWAKKYIKMRSEIYRESEQFLIFRDGSPLQAYHMRNLLRKTLNNLKLDGNLYDIHSFRIGRATDLSKRGYCVEHIKRMGRWKSNAVYKYLRD